MSFQLTIPRAQNSALSIQIDEGKILFVLGANGTGKSSLMHKFYTFHPQAVRRISAHRQTWFESSTVSITAQGKQQAETNMRSWDLQGNARWTDNAAAQRPTIAIFDLVDAENVRARSIAGAVDAKNIELAKKFSEKDAPIKIINELLRISNLPIQISIQSNEEIVASKLGGPSYGIAQLSDGERNALLIAADVLIAKAGTLFLIDEPERHLHRSIISPLLTGLFNKRNDCAFIVSTHDISLPLDNPKSQTLLIRRCLYSGASVSGWDVDLMLPETAIDETLKRDILGARRKVLFVEGVATSLDQPLYSLIFPEVSVLPKESCRDVEHAVNGIRGADELHWVQAFGVIDNDGRSEEDIAKLKAQGIYALSVVSVESIYYHPEMQRRVAGRQATVTGYDVQTMLANARAAMLQAITPHAQRLSERMAEKAVRKEIFSRLPRREDIQKAQPMNISIDVPAFVTKEIGRLQTALASSDITTLLERYPIRETPALDKIAKALGFQDRNQYEAAVQKLLLDQKDAVAFVRSLFGALAADIGV